MRQEDGIHGDAGTETAVAAYSTGGPAVLAARSDAARGNGRRGVVSAVRSRAQPVLPWLRRAVHCFGAAAPAPLGTPALRADLRGVGGLCRGAVCRMAHPRPRFIPLGFPVRGGGAGFCRLCPPDHRRAARSGCDAFAAVGRAGRLVAARGDGTAAGSPTAGGVPSGAGIRAAPVRAGAGNAGLGCMGIERV